MSLGDGGAIGSLPPRPAACQRRATNRRRRARIDRHRRERELSGPLARIYGVPAPDDMPGPPDLADGNAVTDAALMGRLAGGEPAALDPLYRRHRGTVYRFALMWSGSPAAAADVTQDVFVHLITRAGDWEPGAGALVPWLLGIARNFVRRRCGVREGPLPDDGADGELPDARLDSATPDALCGTRQDLARLRHAIAALPPHYRDVLVLVELAERSYAETAAICGCELNTVRSRLARARGLLARWLALDTATTAAATTAAGTRRPA